MILLSRKPVCTQPPPPNPRLKLPFPSLILGITCFNINLFVVIFLVNVIIMIRLRPEIR